MLFDPTQSNPNYDETQPMIPATRRREALAVLVRLLHSFRISVSHNLQVSHPRIRTTKTIKLNLQIERSYYFNFKHGYAAAMATL
jgi:hypothetical protein